MPNIEKLKQFFAKDLFALSLGIEIVDIKEHQATCELILKETHYNAGESVQGGVLFTLGDFAFAVASNSAGFLTVSLNNTISYFSPPKGNKLTATATRLNSTKRTCIYEVSLLDTYDTLVAKMTVTGYIKDIPLDVV